MCQPGSKPSSMLFFSVPNPLISVASTEEGSAFCPTSPCPALRRQQRTQGQAPSREGIYELIVLFHTPPLPQGRLEVHTPSGECLGPDTAPNPSWGCADPG